MVPISARSVAGRRMGVGAPQRHRGPAPRRSIDYRWHQFALDGSTRCAPPPPSATSAITRRTPMPAGPTPDCRPRRSGRRREAAGIDPARGNLLDSRPFPARRRGRAPRRAPPDGRRCPGMDGHRLSPLSRLAPGRGGGGQYNGKFMSGQFVLRASCCPPRAATSRASYSQPFLPPSTLAVLPASAREMTHEAAERKHERALPPRQISPAEQQDVLGRPFLRRPQGQPRRAGSTTTPARTCSSGSPRSPNIIPPARRPASSRPAAGNSPARIGAGPGR